MARIFLFVMPTCILFGIAVSFNTSLMVAGWGMMVLIYLLVLFILINKQRNTDGIFKAKTFFSDAVPATIFCLVGAGLFSILGVIAPA